MKPHHYFSPISLPGAPTQGCRDLWVLFENHFLRYRQGDQDPKGLKQVSQSHIRKSGAELGPETGLSYRTLKSSEAQSNSMGTFPGDLPVVNFMPNCKYQLPKTIHFGPNLYTFLDSTD